MKRSRDKKTTAANLEEKFDRGEDVLDYFDVGKARVIDPKSKQSPPTAKFSYPVKRNSVREKSARYRKK